MRTMFDSLANLAKQAPPSADTLSGDVNDRALLDFAVNSLAQAPPQTIHINFSKDSILYYATTNGKMAGDYTVFNRQEGKRYKRSKWDIGHVYAEAPLRAVDASPYDYQITDKDSRKLIHGIECYKVLLVREHGQQELGENVPLKMEKSLEITEMYVTELVNLPTGMVNGIYSRQQDYFPLEIMEYTTSPESKTTYRLRKIEVE